MIFLLIISLVNYASCSEMAQITQTVYGFLDFTTTIGNTIMVFSPQSSPQDIMINSTYKINNIIETRPHNQGVESSISVIKPTPLIVLSSKRLSTTTLHSSVETSNRSILLSTPQDIFYFSEYALLSRQPEEFIEETYKLINLKSRSESQRHKIDNTRRDDNRFSSALSSKIRESIGKTGTSKYSSKFSQIHQHKSNSERKSKTLQSSAQRILTTVSPPLPRNNTYLKQNENTKTNRKNNRVTSVKRKISRSKAKRNKSTQISDLQIAATSIELGSRRTYKTKFNIETDELIAANGKNTLMLNRRPGRWQYKSLPKPKVNIRKNTSNIMRSEQQIDLLKINSSVSDNNESIQEIQNTIYTKKDLEAVGSQNGITENEGIKPYNFIETLNVDISTPTNFDGTYYEILTIKTPYIFLAGSIKKTRFLTVTSTLQKSIGSGKSEENSHYDGPLSENILESTNQIKTPPLDGSITTLSPIYLTDNAETPELKTITESFSFTQMKLKTQILPFIFEKKNETVQLTLTQTYSYTNLVILTQTLSPLRDNFIPSKNFKDFEAVLDEAGSEINLDLEFGDDGNSGQFDIKSNYKMNIDPNGLVNFTNIKSRYFDSPGKSDISVINSLSHTNSLIISTRPVIRLDTVWESYVVPLVRGTESVLKTLSKAVGVVEKTEYVTDISTIVLPMSQYPYSINPFFNPLLAIPQQHLVTSTSIFATSIIETRSKVLKLTFGARTAYTTIFSTSIIPTEVSKLVVETIPIQNSGSFPNIFPPPFPPLAYVG